MIVWMMILLVVIGVFFVAAITTKRGCDRIYDEQTRRRLSQRRLDE